jgi:hypothetical protein
MSPLPKEELMKAFLATVLSVIAVGVLLIAYGLLAPHASAASQVTYDPQSGTYSLARPMFASERIALPGAGNPAYGYQEAPVQYNTPGAYRPVVYSAPVEYPVAQVPPVRSARASRAAGVSQRTSAAGIDRAPGRNWKKTALVIGGSTATAAGIGGLIGGKKGALIGAAIGGGASTLYEVKH